METRNNSISTPTTPEAMVEQLRTLRQQVPEYTQMTKTEAGNLHKAANVDRHFVQATINTLGAAPMVQTALGKTPDAMLQETAELARWTAVEEELRAMLKGVMSANLTRRYRIGQAALLTYSISRQLIRQPQYSDLLPYVQEMQRLNRTGRRKKGQEVKAKPQVQPSPPTP